MDADAWRLQRDAGIELVALDGTLYDQARRLSGAPKIVETMSAMSRAVSNRKFWNCSLFVDEVMYERHRQLCSTVVNILHISIKQHPSTSPHRGQRQVVLQPRTDTLDIRLQCCRLHAPDSRSATIDDADVCTWVKATGGPLYSDAGPRQIFERTAKSSPNARQSSCHSYAVHWKIGVVVSSAFQRNCSSHVDVSGTDHCRPHWTVTRAVSVL